MKTTLLSLFLLCTCALAAQSTFRSISENRDEEGYQLSIRLDDAKADALFEIYKELSGTSVKDLKGTSETEFDSGITLSLNTYRNKLSLSYPAGDPKTMKAGEEMAAAIKERLGIVSPPSPPSPPRY
jgi:hypothetical protein